jgi:hypothetical protein
MFIITNLKWVSAGFGLVYATRQAGSSVWVWVGAAWGGGGPRRGAAQDAAYAAGEANTDRK